MGKYACLAYVGVSEEGASRGSKPFLTEFPAPFSNPRISSESERDTECRARERNDAPPSPFLSPALIRRTARRRLLRLPPPSTKLHITGYRVWKIRRRTFILENGKPSTDGLRLTADSGYVPDRVPQGSTSPGVPR